MNKTIGRNDPCTCGSGKKYKNCCMLKNAPKPAGQRKLTAKWINAPQAPNLYEKTFGDAISSSGKIFKPLNNKDQPEVKEDQGKSAE